jgi:hypothetical protein
MKKVALVFIIFCLFAPACSEQLTEVQLSELKDHNMKIIPEKPTSKDEIKLVVYDDCTYNVLSGVTRNGSIIDINKQFNSMMKWPCIAQNDTILIGQLPEGNYTVNYKLLDTSTQVTNPTALSFSFSLPVSK